MIKQEKTKITHFLVSPSVRLCEDRLTLVGECMGGRSTAYRHGSLLQHLAGLLRVCGEDSHARQAKVLILIAQAALKVSG